MSDEGDRRQHLLGQVGAPFTAGTYVVLDIGGPAAIEVMEVRRRHGYDYLGALPVEITVAGSGGVGSPAEDQDAGDFFAVLTDIAARTPSFTARFAEPVRFPGTDIFALQVDDEAPFRDLHDQIVQSGLSFDESPHPFGPHCTLRQGPAPTDDEVADLLATEITEPFVCPMLSVYVADTFPLRLRHRAYLR
jgi:2'-5' RNA ligase